MTLLSTSVRRAAAPVAAALVLLTGCGSTRTLESPAAVARPSGVPHPFYVAQRTSAAAEAPGATCAPIAVSPISGRRLELVRAGKGVGDYATAGSGGGDLQRLDCVTGAVLGVVRASPADGASSSAPAVATR